MRRGISPVIATVIIVAVAIAISIAVATWVMGLWSGLGEYSAVKIVYGGLEQVTAGNDTAWNLTLLLANDGVAPARIDSIQVKGETIDIDETILPGETKTLEVTLPASITITPGETVDVKVYTSDGAMIPYPVKAR